ncbi:vegetative cell wall protein gp1-like [Cebus imitator]|uniref:vegetative cell wall protein gp1-like n=1 Tax=Cebus imitator TaxID=2715852 RepID=UPI00189B39C2|nr:vegetative cell wall protein gp1-like [Cebus imitator]
MAAGRDPPLLPPSLGSGRVPGQPLRRQLRQSEADGPPRPQPSEARHAPGPALRAPAPHPASRGPCPPSTRTARDAHRSVRDPPLLAWEAFYSPTSSYPKPSFQSHGNAKSSRRGWLLWVRAQLCKVQLQDCFLQGAFPPSPRNLPNRRDRLLQETPPPSLPQPRRRKKAPFCCPSNRQRTPVARATVLGLPSAFAWASPVTRTTATRSGQPSTRPPSPRQPSPDPQTPGHCPGLVRRPPRPKSPPQARKSRGPTSQGSPPPPARLLASPGRGTLLLPRQGAPGWAGPRGSLLSRGSRTALCCGRAQPPAGLGARSFAWDCPSATGSSSKCKPCPSPAEKPPRLPLRTESKLLAAPGGSGCVASSLKPPCSLC